ncbi:MAG: hypothetical protein HY906_13055 [Deltaproteobacteria bacterium]|nr:hypothetical protein [Deltaproteobacteria bacterium]
MSHCKIILGLAVAATLIATACGGGGGNGRTTCNPAATPTGCSGDYQCEVVAGATDGGALGHCYPPAYLEVTVLDPTAEDEPVGGARVVVTDADTGAAAAPAGTTASSGVARIAVVWPRAEPDLTPGHSFNIRVSAAGYYEYPGATRVSIPVTVSRDPLKALDPAQATIRIISMAVAPKGAITGSVLQADGKTPARGVLVVAETSNLPLVGFSAVSDTNGEYAMYNVESGSYMLSGLFAGMSFPQSNVSVSGSAVHAKLVADATPLLATVTGQVNIVSSGGLSSTNVVLRMRTTWDVPPGLQVAVSGGGGFQIPDVPTGIYEAVAGWGNDGLVLDPDPNIAGTQIQEISVVGQSPPATVPLAGSFKVTDAVQILGPGATTNDETVGVSPIFRWKKYAQASFYKVYLWDGISPDAIWTLDGSVTSITAETVTYPGAPDAPAIVPGLMYQWWVEAWADTPDVRELSHSEDQLGVFRYVAQ